MKKLALVLPFILLLGCSSGVSISDIVQEFNLGGSWTGTITSNSLGGGSLSIVFSQATESTEVTGTASIVGHPCFSGGAVEGTAINGTVNITVTPASGGAAAPDITLNMAGSGSLTSLSGIYEGIHSVLCPTGDNGSWSISR